MALSGLSACAPSKPPLETLDECVKQVFQTTPKATVHAYQVVNQYLLRVENEDRVFFDVIAFLPDDFRPLNDDGTLDVDSLRGTVSFAKRGKLWHTEIVERPQAVSATYPPSPEEAASIAAALVNVRQLEAQWEMLKPKLQIAWETRYAAISRSIKAGTIIPADGQSKPVDLVEAEAAYDALDKQRKNLEEQRHTTLSSVFTGPIRRL